MNLDIHVMRTENGWFVSANCHKTEFGAPTMGGLQGIAAPEYEQFKPRQAVFTTLEELKGWIARVTDEVLDF